MNTVTVVNKNKESNHIYCGRGSPLGNPYIMGYSADRDRVCDLYENWFYKHVNETTFLSRYHERAKMVKLATPQEYQLFDIVDQALEGDVNLGCFCAPKRCHCDTIKTFIDNKLKELEA